MIDPLLAALMRRDFYTFVQRVFRELAAGEQFYDSWAVEAMCYALAEAGQGRRRRQIINVPPRSLKSICASVALPAWLLGHNPTAKIICVSYSGDLADQFSAACRQVMKSAWYQELFPSTRISPLKDSEGFFKTTAGGYRDATSIGGTLTGKGGSLIVIDDPAKPDEVMSEAQRLAINGWYGRTLLSRLNNKLKDGIILVMQRLHVDDLVAHVQERERWDVLSLPAIAEVEERVQLGPQRWHHRLMDEVLKPETEPLEILMELKAAMGTQAFSSQYQQRPIPLEGEMVKLAWFKRYDEPPVPPRSRIVHSWDIAITSTAGADWTACVTAAVYFGEIYILDVSKAKLEFPAVKKEVIRRAFGALKPDHIVIEDNGAGTALIQQLRHERLDGMIAPEGYKPRVDKKTRLTTVSPMIEQGRVYLPRNAPWLSDFLAELLAFPQVRHDDQVDAFVQLLAWVARREQTKSVIQRRPMYGPIPKKPKTDWKWDW